MAKPLLLLDVDGPLNPYRLITRKGFKPPKPWRGEPPCTYERHQMKAQDYDGPVLLSRDHGRELTELRDLFTIVWATTWEHDANQLIGPAIGLDDCPVIEWPARAHEWTLRPVGSTAWGGTGSGVRHVGSWKTPHILAWLDQYGRDENGDPLPWVFIDDEIRSDDRRFVRDHYGEDRRSPQVVPRWLLEIHPLHGLRSHNFVELREWGAKHLRA